MSHSRPGGQPVRSRTANRFPGRTSKKPLHVPVRKRFRTGSGRFSPKKSACGKLVSSNRACKIHGWPFSPKKKAPAASWLAATGLVKSWVAIFAEKKAPAASWLAATGLVESLGGHFHRRKGACGKLVSSNRACRILGWSIWQPVRFGSEQFGLVKEI